MTKSFSAAVVPAIAAAVVIAWPQGGAGNRAAGAQDETRPIAARPRPMLHQHPLDYPSPNPGWPVEINPPTFRWPAFGARPFTVEIGQRSDLSDARILGRTSETFLRPSDSLSVGSYWWRIRTADGKTSPTVAFAVTDKAARWRIPPWDQALAKVPKGRPRLMMRPEDLPRLRGLAGRECRELVAIAEKRMETIVGRELPKPVGLGRTVVEKEVLTKGFANDVASPIEDLSILYLLTSKRRYAAEIRRRALYAAEQDPEGPVSIEASDFANGYLVSGMAWAYDTLYDQWAPEEKRRLRVALLARCRNGFSRHIPEREQYLIHNHAWQRLLRQLTEGALALYDEYPDARDWFAWSFKMHVAQYPWFGGADGGSAEGLGYYKGNNMLTSLKASRLFEAATGVGLLDNPWFRNTGYYLLYMNGLGDAGSQFGDVDKKGRNPGPDGKLATLLWAAKFLDPYMAAYHEAIDASFPQRAENWLRLYWHPLVMVRPRPLRELPKAHLFPSIGLAVMRSALIEPDNDIFLEFRSSPYGFERHFHADQNSFNLIAFGQKLVLDSGYYNYANSPHNRLWSRQSRAHNTILVGRKGQGPRSTDARGRIVDFEIGHGFVRVVGSCPEAYGDVKVTKFDRHVLWLEPNTYLIADDLETSEPQEFQWLLHALEKMDVAGNTILLKSGEAGARLRFFDPSQLRITLTDQFDPPVTDGKPGADLSIYVNQWHLTASTTRPATAQKFVSILQVFRRTVEGARLPEPVVLHDAAGVSISLPDGRTGRINWR